MISIHLGDSLPMIEILELPENLLVSTLSVMGFDKTEVIKTSIQMYEKVVEDSNQVFNESCQNEIEIIDKEIKECKMHKQRLDVLDRTLM